MVWCGGGGGGGRRREKKELERIEREFCVAQ